MTHADIWFDGASRGNPGPMAGGVVLAMDGRKEVLHGPPGRGTNNEAEYHGLLLGLETAAARGASSVHVRGDSELIIRQLEGKYKVKAANLKPYFDRAKQLLAGFDQVTLEWVRRADNAEADQAANDALDVA